MGHLTILNRTQPSARFYGTLEPKVELSVEELAREVEVLRGKLSSLKLAYDRIDRELQRVSGQVLEAQRRVTSTTHA